MTPLRTIGAVFWLKRSRALIERGAANDNAASDQQRFERSVARELAGDDDG